MIAVAGALGRHGAPGEDVVARLRAAVAAEGGAVHEARSGPLVVCAAVPVHREGDALAVVEADHATAAELLAGWRVRGDAALAALRGAFAAVLWDGREGVLARDHLGLAGLVVHDDGTTAVFANEPHVLLRALPRTPGPDPASLAHWLAVSVPPGDRTLLQGVTRVPPAGVVPLDPDGARPPRRHWDPRYREPRQVGTDQAAHDLREALATAVRRADAGAHRTGVQLSGGLDSGAVAGLAAATLPDPPRRAYSATFPDHPQVDETAQIDRVARATGLAQTHAEVRRGALLAGVVPYVARYALPPVSPNLAFWLPLLHAAAADGTTVLLDGEGGDEVFAGAHWLVADRLRRGPRAAARVVRTLPGGPQATPRQVARATAKLALRGLPPAAAHTLARRARRGGGVPVAHLGPALAAAYRATAPHGAWKRHGGPRWWAWQVEATTRTGAALAYEHQRHRAALAGIAPRHPLVDVDVVELVLSLPPELALDPARSRPLLRAAVAGLVPDEVRLRPDKSTFDAVFHEALAGPELAPARHLLGPGARLRAHLDGAALDALLAAPPTTAKPRQWWALQAWRALTAECWLRGLEDAGALAAEAERLGVTQPDVRLSTR